MRYHIYKRWLTPPQRLRWRYARAIKRTGIGNVREGINCLEYVLYRAYDGRESHFVARGHALFVLGNPAHVSTDSHEWWDHFVFPENVRELITWKS